MSARRILSCLNIFHKILALLCFVLFMAPRQIALAAPAQELLVVTIGGFDTCARDGAGGYRLGSSSMFPLAMEVQQHINENPDVHVQLITACFGLERGPLKSEMNFCWTLNPQMGASNLRCEWFPGNFENSMADSFAQGKLPEPFALFFADLQAEIHRGTPRPVYVIGHSYGGWTAMLASVTLPERTFSLITIDPISPLRCNPRVIRNARFGISSQCFGAPIDQIFPDFQRVRTHAQYWTHYYQTQGIMLKSGSIPEADVDESICLPKRGDGLLDGAHLRIARDDGVWLSITNWLMRSGSYWIPAANQ